MQGPVLQFWALLGSVLIRKVGGQCGLTQAQPARRMSQVPLVAWEVQREGASIPARLEDHPVQNFPARMVVLLQRRNEQVGLVDGAVVRSVSFLSLACCSTSRYNDDMAKVTH